MKHVVITFRTIEAASKAAYKVVCEQAPKYHAGTQLERFVPWEQVDEDWKNDFRLRVRAALEAAHAESELL